MTTTEEEKGTAFESTRREQKRVSGKSVSLKVAVKEECKM